MGESNGAWGELAQHDDELAEVWDSFSRLPEAGDNAALDAFVDRKSISIASLVRLGARMADSTVLAFGFPGGIKFRDVVLDSRWSYAGSTWHQLKIVRRGTEPSRLVIVAEGETDSAWLTEHYDCDIAVLPAGADPRPHTDSYAQQLASYDMVLLGQDADRAGDVGAALLADKLPQAVRFAPPGNDWCSSDGGQLPQLPDPDEIEVALEMKVLVPAGELLALEPPPVISWFEHALLPVAGQLILHGWAKSFKTFLALDLFAALCQGQPWCDFEPTEEPCRVAVMQYEIPWAYYQQRVLQLAHHAKDRDLFNSNFLTVTPLQRPRFRAGNVAQEDFILKSLTDADIQVFLLDPIRRATGAIDLNSEKEIRPLLAFFERLQNEGITVVTTHHDNKTYAKQGGGDPLGMTGAGAFSGDADTIISVSLPRGKRIEDPERNLHFLMRNAPSVGPRGMSMSETGQLSYTMEPHGDWHGDEGTGEPAI